MLSRSRTTSCCSSPTACAPAMINDRPRRPWPRCCRRGVRFTNTHSLFPTFTTRQRLGDGDRPLCSGDTGDFSNTIYTGFPVPARATA